MGDDALTGVPVTGYGRKRPMGDERKPADVAGGHGAMAVERRKPTDVASRHWAWAIGRWRAGGCGWLGRWLSAGENRRMWSVDIGADDGWGVGGCGRLSPLELIFGPSVAIDGWVIPPSLGVSESSSTVPRVSSSWG